MQRLPPWLTPSAIAALSLEPGQAVGLPGEAYTEEAAFDIERTSVLARTWVCTALEADIAEPGDLFPVTIAGIDLLLARDRNRAIHGFHNVCVHRGAQLVDAPQKGRPLIVCPYHAWAYRLGGELQRTPHIGGPGIHACPEFAAGGIVLSRVRVATWAGLVFVNLDGATPALDDYLAPLQQHLSAYDFSVLRHGGGVSFDLRANWKLGVENFLDATTCPSSIRP